MSKEQLQANKAKLEKGLNNKNLTDAQKELAKTRIAQIDVQLADLKKKESKEPEETKEPAKKSDNPKATETQPQLKIELKKKPKENKEAFKSDCAETVA